MSLGISSSLPLVFLQVQALGSEWQGGRKERGKELGLIYIYAEEVVDRWRWCCALIAKAE